MYNIEYAFRMAKKYYTKELYDHAVRVAAIVAENNMIPDDRIDMCIALAMMHDLTEEIGYSIPSEVGDRFIKCMDLLRKHEDMDYDIYFSEIKKHSEKYPEAYWVMTAEMKDYLTVLAEDAQNNRLAGSAWGYHQKVV